MNRHQIDINAKESQPLNHPLHPQLIVIRLKNGRRIKGQCMSILEFPQTFLAMSRRKTPATVVFQNHAPAIAKIREFLRI